MRSLPLIKDVKSRVYRDTYCYIEVFMIFFFPKALSMVLFGLLCFWGELWVLTSTFEIEVWKLKITDLCAYYGSLQNGCI